MKYIVFPNKSLARFVTTRIRVTIVATSVRLCSPWTWFANGRSKKIRRPSIRCRETPATIPSKNYNGIYTGNSNPNGRRLTSFEYKTKYNVFFFFRISIHKFYLVLFVRLSQIVRHKTTGDVFKKHYGRVE